MKTTTKTLSISIFNRSLFSKFLVVFATVFVFGLVGFNTEFNNKSESSLMPGVVFEIEVKEHMQSPPKTEEMKVMVEGKNLAMEMLPDENTGKGKMIFRGDRGKNGEVIFVDDDKKEYYIMDDSFVSNVMKQVDQSKSMMNEAMKNLTKEQRDMIEQMQKEKGAKIPGLMGQQSKPKLSKTGERGTKMGYPCVKYEVRLDGNKIREIWTTDWNNIDGGDEARIAFGGMNNFFDKLRDKFSDMPGGIDFFEEMNFNNGFPVVTKGFNAVTGDLEDESTLRSSRRQQIDPDAFEPPSGYKRQEMFGGN